MNTEKLTDPSDGHVRETCCLLFLTTQERRTRTRTSRSKFNTTLPGRDGVFCVFRGTRATTRVCVCVSVCASVCVRERRRRRRVAPSPEIGAWGSHIRFRAHIGCRDPSFLRAVACNICPPSTFRRGTAQHTTDVWILSSSERTRRRCDVWISPGFDLLFSASGFVWAADGTTGTSKFENSGNRMRRCAVSNARVLFYETLLTNVWLEMHLRIISNTTDFLVFTRVVGRNWLSRRFSNNTALIGSNHAKTSIHPRAHYSCFVFGTCPYNALH